MLLAVYTGLLGILILIGSLEVALNESKGLKKAASGFDRLVVKDEEREVQWSDL